MCLGDNPCSGLNGQYTMNMIFVYRWICRMYRVTIYLLQEKKGDSLLIKTNFLSGYQQVFLHKIIICLNLNDD